MSHEEKIFKCALLLGLALGGLRSMYEIEIDEKDVGSILYESMSDLIQKLEKGIEELFYKE